MPDSFTSALLAALNAADDVEPSPDADVLQGRQSLGDLDLSGRHDLENRFAKTIGYGMAKVRAAGT